jgi:hypothetical protein
MFDFFVFVCVFLLLRFLSLSLKFTDRRSDAPGLALSPPSPGRAFLFFHAPSGRRARAINARARRNARAQKSNRILEKAEKDEKNCRKNRTGAQA